MLHTPRTEIGFFNNPMVGRILGHTQTQTTERYAHLADDPLQKASERIASSLKQAMEIGHRS